MSCPNHRATDNHCIACRRAIAAPPGRAVTIDDARFVRAQIATLPAPTLSAARRAALAAEVMARADLHDDTRALRSRRPWVFIAAGVLAAAGALILLREQRALPSKIVARTHARAVVTVEPTPPVPVAPAVVERAPQVVVDEAPPPAPAPPKPVRVDRTRQVFGATTDHHGAAIERDMLVEATPLEAFRIGWEALRERRYDDAIAAFDRATDPAVAEDAAFWAAIAAQRAGHADDARKRLDAFSTRFPDSPRADDARRAREVLR